MRPDLHLDPTELRAVAATVVALLPALRPPTLDPDDLAALAAVRDGPEVVAAHDRLTASTVRAGRELAELAAALDAAAGAVGSAEVAAVRSVTAADR